jgi:DNA-binding transcriptional ArsR family regulator
LKAITEIDDPRFVKALAHPLRVQILRVLQDRVASPSEIADELSASLGNVSYHVRFLARADLLELVETRPRRGAIEHYYRARGRVQITDSAWAQVPQVVKDAMVAAALDQLLRYVTSAATLGGFDRGNAHISRTALTLDEQGFAELGQLLRELLERAIQIETASSQRIAADPAPATISAGLALMLFEGPPQQTDPPAARKRGTASTPRRNR